MNNFYNTEYLQERLSAVLKENERLRKICERQAEMNHTLVKLTLELEAAERKLEKYRDAQA